MIQVRVVRLLLQIFPSMAAVSALSLLLSGCGGAHFVNPPAPAPVVSIAASPSTITAGSSATLTVTATNATSVMVSGTDGSSFNLAAAGGTQTVSPAKTTTYTATATGSQGSTTATMTITVCRNAPTHADGDDCCESRVHHRGRIIDFDGRGHQCDHGDHRW